MTDDKYPSIYLNGYQDPNGEDESYETFCLVFDGEWGFCKTGRYPYDLAVKTLLMLANKYGLLTHDEDSDSGSEKYGWDFDGECDEEEYIRAHDLLVGLELI